MERIKEESTAYLSVAFYDRAGELEAPSSISYRVDDVVSESELLDDTEVESPASQITITLPPSVNAIVDPTMAEEKRRVTISASYGLDDGVKDQYDYLVLNLRFVPQA